MKKMTVEEIEEDFDEVFKRVLAGDEIGILYGEKSELVARIVPLPKKPSGRRKLGVLKGKGTVKFGPDFKMTEEEFLGL